MEDLADFHVGVNAPANGTYKGIDIYTCGPWCQGHVSIQALQILEGVGLKSMGHNSADYIHAVLEALSLSLSDREAFYGDPDFVNVPMEGLLSKSYAEERRAMIDMQKAFGEMPEAGDPWRHQGMESPNGKPARPEPVGGGLQADTSYTAVIDRWGNAFSATPSDTIAYNPIIPGLGFIVSGRGSQSWLDHNHPSSLQPGKRPRLTPNPALAMKDGKPLMPFGTPGGDVQPQSMVQLFLNVVEFGMEVQEAIEAPRVSTWGFPNSFWPHAYNPGLVGVEGRIDSEVVEALRKRGHAVEVWDDFTPRMGCLCAIHVDQERGSRNGGADPRRDGYAMGR
jgi:gamma-glutamyltranspeptidase/glutathione hydrolase